MKKISPTPVVLIIVTLAVIGITLRPARRDKTPPQVGIPQESSQIETRAYYIAQTALDRSVKALVANPTWREGFENIRFEDGTYDVRIIADEEGDDLPPGYVRIVASSEVDGIRKEVEAVWVNTMAAFANTYTAGDRIELVTHDALGAITLGSVHNNACDGGPTDVSGGMTVYGNVAGRGGVNLGAASDTIQSRVFGSVRGSHIILSSTAEIRRFRDLSEWIEGIDLNGDGDATDTGLNADPIHVAATTAVTVGQHTVANGSTDGRIGQGSVRVSVGGSGAGQIVDPRPDFGAYYELVTGLSTYPPLQAHVSTPLAGDGDGHYFRTSAAFTDWLREHNPVAVGCWRCAGDGRIDPGNTSECPDCAGVGQLHATEVAGVFYIDDATADLSELGRDLIVHGTIVVAEGDPYTWPSKTVRGPAGEQTIAHFPRRGEFALKGPRRMNFTQTYRSSTDNAAYRWRNRMIFGGENTQTIAIPEPSRNDPMRDFPAIIAAARIAIEPRGAGFAYHPGDIGDEALTVLQGIVYAEEEVRLHGRGGWKGDAIVFDENLPRESDDSLDEPVFNVDLNGDGDRSDRVELSSISDVPLIPLRKGQYAVDINADGVLGNVTIGSDYVRFFNDNGYLCPILIYHEGIVAGQSIHSCDETLVILDPLIAQTGTPFGFELSVGSAAYQGLVSWEERLSD